MVALCCFYSTSLSVHGVGLLIKVCIQVYTSVYRFATKKRNHPSRPVRSLYSYKGLACVFLSTDTRTSTR